VEKLSIIAVDIVHDNCWTEITKEYDVNIKLLSQEFVDDSYFTSKILVLGKHSKDLIKKLKYHEYLKINNLNYLDNYGFVIDFIYPRYNSISNLFHETRALILSHRIINGVEKWRVIVNPQSIPYILDKIEKWGDLLLFKKMELDKFERLMDKLTDKNLGLLKVAFNKGLFEYPRRNTLMNLSKELGIKPNTLLYHIRKSEKVLLEILIEEYYSLL